MGEARLQAGDAAGDRALYAFGYHRRTEAILEVCEDILATWLKEVRAVRWLCQDMAV